MRGYGIINLGPNLALFEESHQGIALTVANDELIINVTAIRGLSREHYTPHLAQRKRGAV